MEFESPSILALSSSTRREKEREFPGILAWVLTRGARIVNLSGGEASTSLSWRSHVVLLAHRERMQDTVVQDSRVYETVRGATNQIFIHVNHERRRSVCCLNRPQGLVQRASHPVAFIVSSTFSLLVALSLTSAPSLDSYRFVAFASSSSRKS